MGGSTCPANLCHLYAYSRKDSPLFFLSPSKNCAIGSYLSIELVILQKCIGHLSPVKGLFQFHIPCGNKTSQVIRENLVKQRMIVPTRCHLSTKHVQMGIGISSAIILEKLKWLELRRHKDLREIGQSYPNLHFLGLQSPLWFVFFQSSSLLDFWPDLARFWGRILRRIYFKVTPMWDEWRRGLALVWIWWRLGLIFRPRYRAL